MGYEENRRERIIKKKIDVMSKRTDRKTAITELAGNIQMAPLTLDTSINHREQLG